MTLVRHEKPEKVEAIQGELDSIAVANVDGKTTKPDCILFLIEVPGQQNMTSFKIHTRQQCDAVITWLRKFREAVWPEN